MTKSRTIYCTAVYTCVLPTECALFRCFFTFPPFSCDQRYGLRYCRSYHDGLISCERLPSVANQTVPLVSAIAFSPGNSDVSTSEV